MNMKDFFLDMDYRKYYSPYVDEHDNPVKRTKSNYPYNYDGYVLWRNFRNEKANTTVYSDRLEQWNREKTKLAWDEHCKGYRYDNVPKENLLKFLRDRLDNNKIEIVFLMEYCNHATGYPVWRIDYFNGKE